MSRVTMFDVQFDNYDFSDLLGYIDETIRRKDLSYILTCNVDHLIKLRKDAEFQQVYSNAGAIVADGMPIVWASKFLRKPLKMKVSGSDLFHKLGRSFEKREYRLFFLGSDIGIPELAKSNLQMSFPNLNVVGCYSPSYGFEQNQEENKQIVDMLIDVKPDIVFVGVGAPKQEKWIYQHYLKYRVPVSIGVGATFDFLSGTIKRAPDIMQKTGFEWFWRLAQEPRRLWRRYLLDDPMFLRMVLKEYVKSNRVGQEQLQEEERKGAD